MFGILGLLSLFEQFPFDVIVRFRFAYTQLSLDSIRSVFACHMQIFRGIQLGVYSLFALVGARLQIAPSVTSSLRLVDKRSRSWLQRSLCSVERCHGHNDEEARICQEAMA